METELLRDEGDGLCNELEELIYAFNVAVTEIDDGRSLRLAYRDGTELVAGLCGWTWGASAYIDLLWVREDRRGEGLGTTLIAAAEAEAVLRGCKQILLSTHTFQAPDMYRHRGYQEYGRIDDHPAGHAQLHLVKRFEQGAA